MGMSMPGMKAGVTKLGTATLHHGTASFKLKAMDVVGMPLEVMYGGNKMFSGSRVTPTEATESAP